MPRPQILVVDDAPELLNLLTNLLRENGFDPIPSSKGREAQKQAQQNSPALAILDVLLPDMTGFQLADTLRRDRPDLPLVFITGVFKGPRQTAAAKAKYGALDYFEKPFDAHALLECVRAHLQTPAIPSPEKAPALMGNEPPCEEDRRLDPMEISGVVRFASGKPSFSSPSSIPSGPMTLQPPSFRLPSRPPSAPLDGSGAERGVLQENLPSLFNAFHQSQETGELVLTRGRMKKVIFFQKGRPVFARSNVVSDRLGQFLVRIGKISEAQRKDVARIAGEEDASTVQGLRTLGLLGEPECAYYMGQQVKSIIYSVFCWDEGDYAINFRQGGLDFPLELDLHPGNLILRSIRRLYKGDRLQRLLSLEDRPTPSQQPTYALNELEMEPWEAKLLPLADGTRTVSDLVGLSGQPALKAMAFLYAMVALTILEKR